MFALIWINFKRDQGRKLLTLLSLLIAFVLFGVLMALRQALTFDGTGVAAAHILVTLNSAGRGKTLPVAYAGRISRIPGVIALSYDTGTLASYQRPNDSFLFLATAGREMLEVQPFLSIPPAQQRAWFQDRTGAIVTPKLMQRFGWKLGERVPVLTQLPQKDGNTTWYVTIDGVLTDPTSHAALGFEKMFVHYSYFDQARAMGEGTVGSISERITRADDAGKVGQAIDALFTNSAPQTRTIPVNAVFRNFYGQIGNISLVIAAVATAVFFSLLLIVGAIMLHSVRERFPEFAVLRVLGFRPFIIGGVVLGEALFTCLIGGILGLILASAVVHLFVHSLNQILATMALTRGVWLAAFGLMVLLGMLVSVLPMAQLWRLSVREALGSA
ncbi:MAG TPA: ABC transporter permease [Steroidobacteraceae bacterium]|nr:ABC transporter permease [Steroidobacteraceae bacterium]